MKIRTLFSTLLIIGALTAVSVAHAYNEENAGNLHDHIVEIFKDIEAVFSWHVEDRKSLKEDLEDTWHGITA